MTQAMHWKQAGSWFSTVQSGGMTTSRGLLSTSLWSFLIRMAGIKSTEASSTSWMWMVTAPHRLVSVQGVFLILDIVCTWLIHKMHQIMLSDTVCASDQLEWSMKLWWPHCEALIAFLMAYSQTKKPELLDRFSQVYEYTFSHVSLHYRTTVPQKKCFTLFMTFKETFQNSTGLIQDVMLVNFSDKYIDIYMLIKYRSNAVYMCVWFFAVSWC